MPDIITPVEYDASQNVVISAKLCDPNFKYSDWGNEDLLELRRHIRNHYRDEQKGVCSYCKRDISLKSASNSHVEHVLPKSLYPKFIFEPKNLCAVCADCNEIKRELESLKEEEDPINGNLPQRYPSTSNRFKIVHPHFDNYEEHIFKCGDLYLDVSPKGSFTLLACRLNRKAHKYGIEPSLLSQEELRELMLAYLSETNFTIQQKLFIRLQEFFIRIS